MHESLNGFKIGQIPPQTQELSALARLKKMLYNVVNSLARSFLIVSSTYLQVTRTSMTSRMSLKFGQIGSRTAKLAALGHLEKSP